MLRKADGPNEVALLGLVACGSTGLPGKAFTSDVNRLRNAEGLNVSPKCVFAQCRRS